MTLSDKDLGKIRAAISERDRARKRLDFLVQKARAQGATWTEVGFAVGITAQGAQKRYGASSERHQATIEEQRANAEKRRQKDARKAARAGSAEPWPDGTVQETMPTD